MKEMIKVQMPWFDNSDLVLNTHWINLPVLFDAEGAEDLQEKINKFIVDKTSYRFKHVKFIDVTRI